MSESFLQQIFEAIEKDPTTTLTVDLPSQTIRLEETNAEESFEINPYKKGNLSNGFDDIDYLLQLKPTIKDFANQQPI